MKFSAGLLMYRKKNNEIEFFLAHPGGPYFKNKDEGFWTIPKGEIELEEDKLEAAKREFYEETGMKPTGPFTPLGETKQNAKIIYAWAFEGNWNENNILSSNDFEMEWPPKSGKIKKFPEIDKVGFFKEEEGVRKILSAQVIFLKRLKEFL